MDTCHAGEVDEDRVAATRDQQALAVRGVRLRAVRDMVREDVPGEKVPVASALLGELFADLRCNSGTVVIAAAGGMESAYESPKWKNGVFTYSVLEGMRDREAAGGAGRELRVSHLQEYVARRVAELTNQHQKPAARRENLVYDFPLVRALPSQLADRDRFYDQARRLRFEGRPGERLPRRRRNWRPSGRPSASGTRRPFRRCVSWLTCTRSGETLLPPGPPGGR